MVVIADTSPITALLYIRHLHLLEKLYGQVYIPFTVANELQSLTAYGYDLSFLMDKDKYIVRHPSNLKLMKALSEYIDAGEAEAIALAKELKADLLLMDEKIGKQFAEAEHLICKGVIGILIEAKKEGYISAIKTINGRFNSKFEVSFVGTHLSSGT